MYTRFACLFPHLRFFKTGSYFEDQLALSSHLFFLGLPNVGIIASRVAHHACTASIWLGARDECSCWALGSQGRAEVLPMLLTMLMIWAYYALSTLPLTPIV